MIKHPSKQLYQQQTPIEIIGLSSDNSQNERRKLPQKPWSVLTLLDDCQNTHSFLKFWIPRLWKDMRQ